MRASWKLRYPLLVGLAAFFLAAAPAVPAEAQAQKPKTVVNYWLWLDDATDPVWARLVKEFNDTHPTIEVRYQLIALAQYHDRLLTAIASGSAPDAARMKDPWIGEFVANDLLVALDKYVDRWVGKDDVIPNLWNTGRVNSTGPVFMLPHQYITFYLYYRKDYLKAAGLSVPGNFDQFVEAAKKLTSPEQNRYGFGLRGGAGGQDQWLAFMLAGGCKMTNEKGEITADSDVCIAANQRYIDLFRTQKVAPPSAPNDAFAQIVGAFQAGITGFAAHHVGSALSMSDKLGKNVGVMAMPVAAGAKPATMAAVTGNVLFKASKSQDAAWTFVSWLTRPKAMDLMSRSKNGQLPVLKSVAAQSFYQTNPFFKLSIDLANYAVTWPSVPGAGVVTSQLWMTEMQKALIGQTTSKDMMAAIATALRKK